MSVNVDLKRVVTGRVRLSYSHLTKPRAAKAGDMPKYSVTFLVPKFDVATRQRMDAAVNAAIIEATAAKWNGVRPPQPANPIYDGDGLRPNGENFSDECKGHWVITASSEQRPEVVDANLNPIINESEIYSGMYANVSCRFFGYFNSGKKGIGCGLGNIQKVDEGEPLGGGRRSASDDFGGNAGGYVSPQVASNYQQPAYQQSAYAPMQPVYSQQQQSVYPQQQQVYAQAPIYPQQPVASQMYPQQPIQIDPITGKPLSGGVMGL